MHRGQPVPGRLTLGKGLSISGSRASEGGALRVTVWAGSKRLVRAHAAADTERPCAVPERGQSPTAATLQSYGWWEVPSDVPVLALLRTRSVRAPVGARSVPDRSNAAELRLVGGSKRCACARDRCGQ